MPEACLGWILDKDLCECLLTASLAHMQHEFDSLLTLLQLHRGRNHEMKEGLHALISVIHLALQEQPLIRTSASLLCIFLVQPSLRLNCLGRMSLESEHQMLVDVYVRPLVLVQKLLHPHRIRFP